LTLATLIDTNIAIHLRDNDPAITTRITDLLALPRLSILTRVELEGGVYARPELAATRRAFIDLMLSQFPFLVFDRACVEAYRVIVGQCGFSRSRILDRMIAATAMAHDLTLITTDGEDFRTIPDLRLEIW